MIPWRRDLQMTGSVIEVFNGLHGEAREKAIATGNYKSLLKKAEPVEPQIEREPGSDD